jgi:hypothetical protein
MSAFVYGIMLLMVLSLTWIVYHIKNAPVMDDDGKKISDKSKEEVTPLWDDNKQHTENFF